MESEAIVDQLMKGEILSQESMRKLGENHVVVEAKDVIELSPPPVVPANGSIALGPITPDSNRESGDLLSDFTSPLTLVSSPSKAFCLGSHGSDGLCFSNEDGPRTPKEDVFDPFAPGPDNLMLAPQCRKYMEESGSYVARRLIFNSSMKFVGDVKHESDAETINDKEMLLETVYGSLLEAIVSKQTEVLLAEILPTDPSPDGLKTPTCAPRLSGIAETCPGAPVKPTRKLRNIDQGLCRKLEF